jgi:hypothetical protein
MRGDGERTKIVPTWKIIVGATMDAASAFDTSLE